MNRRNFLRTAAGASAAIGLGGLNAFAIPASMPLRLVIMHTSDIHSNFEPRKGGETDGLGGVLAREQAITSIRAQWKNTLLLDSGDIMQGTAWFNRFHGEPEIRVMSALNYDASAIGNHDFDAGIERLGEVVSKHAKFPFVCCNYDFKNTPMAGLAKDYTIREFDGLRVGILGIGIKLHRLVLKKLYGDTVYEDPIIKAAAVAKKLRHEEKCDFIVALSHASLYGQRNTDGTMEPGDRIIASSIPEIDIVLGGHNHILMEEPEKISRSATTPGIVMHHGWAGTHLGVLMFDFFGRDKVQSLATSPMPLRV